MNVIPHIMLLVLLSFPLAAPAGPAHNPLQIAARDEGAAARQAPRVGRQQAAAMVKSRYGDSKILSVKLIESKGPPVYRVKILSPGGVVKYVFVDGLNGDVFE